MKNTLIKNVTCLTNEGIESNVNLSFEDGKIQKLNIINDEKSYIIEDGSQYIALPLLPLFKNDIFDIISYKYLNKIDSDFRMNIEDFEKLPFDFLEKSADLVADKMALGGNGFLFYSHLSYQMVKNSLLTISTNINKKYHFSSSLSYLQNSIFPEQKILSDKENSEFKKYVENSNENYRHYHYSQMIDTDSEINNESFEGINHFFVKKGNLEKIEKFIDNDNAIFFIQFEDLDDLKKFNYKFNTYVIIEEDKFKNSDYTNYIYKVLNEDEDAPFILMTGYGVYNIFNSLGAIFKNTKDLNIKKLVKNQLLILPKLIEYITSTKIGVIEEDYDANIMLINRRGFPIEDLDQLIDFFMIYYFESSLPSKIYVNGEKIL